MSDERQTLSIVIPCHNESEGMAHLIGRLEETLPVLAASYQCEVLVVDDGSTDDTFASFQSLAKGKPNYRILRVPHRQGIGAALRLACAETTSEIIVNADADCTYDPRTIPELLSLLSSADIVTGSPYHPDGRVQNVPGWRLLLSKGLSRLYRWTSPVKVHTYTSMFRAYRREVLTRVEWESNGFLSMAEILVGAGRAGYRVEEYPTTLSVRQFGQSKIRIMQVIRDHLNFLIRQAFRDNSHDGANSNDLSPRSPGTASERKAT